MILCLIFTNVYGANFLIGNGSGSFFLNSMTGHSIGDTCYVKDGTYSSGTLDNLIGLVIRPQDNRVQMTGSLEFRNNKGCDWGYFTWLSYSGYAIDMRNFSGNINNTIIHHMSFKNGTGGACINVNSNNSIANYIYGDTTTFAWYKVTLDSIYEYNCPQLVQGSFGAPSNNGGQPPNVFCKTTITRFVSEQSSATSERGTEIRGIQWECNYHDWVITSTAGGIASGDVGHIYGHLSGDFYDIYSNGLPGYIIRAFPSAQLSRPDSINIWNCVKINGREYGLALSQEDPSDSVAGKFGNVMAVNIYNNTAVNCITNITYWCQVAVLGVRGWARYQVRNNLGVNLQTTGKPNKIIQNQGEAWPTISADTSNNLYYNYSTDALLDSNVSVFISNTLGNFYKYKPTLSSGAILKGGTANPFSGVDFAGITRPANGDVGYLQSTGRGKNYLLINHGHRPFFK